MKYLIHYEPFSEFEIRADFKIRWEIEYYSDGTTSKVVAMYYKKKGGQPPFLIYN